MWETMYASNGVGLAAPQVNKDIRLFVVDREQMFTNLERMKKRNIPMHRALKRFLSMHILWN